MGNQASRGRQQPQTNTAGPPQYPPPAIYNTQQPGAPPFYAPQQPPQLPHDPYAQGWRPSYAPPSPLYPGGFAPPQPPPQRPPHGPPQVAAPAPVSVQQYNQTKTIKNACNINKKSLALVPVPGDPLKLQITFLFDATEPCLVSTVVGATEDVHNGNQLKPSKQPVAPGIVYSPGLKLPFPTPGDPRGAMHIVDTSLFEEAELIATSEVPQPTDRTGAPLITYPLAIRMECLAPHAAAEGRSLSSLRPGGRQQSWVQSQTNLALLYRDEQQQWHIKPTSQKLLVEGVNYEVLDIYGVEQNERKAETDEEREDRLCVICLVNERNTTVLPCRHMCMCDECAQELRKQDHKCPICRVPVASLLHIKRFKDGDDEAARPDSRAADPAPSGSGASRGAGLMAKP